MIIMDIPSYKCFEKLVCTCYLLEFSDFLREKRNSFLISGALHISCGMSNINLIFIGDSLGTSHQKHSATPLPCQSPANAPMPLFFTLNFF